MTTEQLTTERGSDYGHPKDNFALIAKYWSIWKGVEFAAADVPMMNILQKIAREQYKHKGDNIADIEGYAHTIKMLQDED